MWEVLFSGQAIIWGKFGNVSRDNYFEKLSIKREEGCRLLKRHLLFEEIPEINARRVVVLLNHQLR